MQPNTKPIQKRSQGLISDTKQTITRFRYRIIDKAIQRIRIEFSRFRFPTIKRMVDLFLVYERIGYRTISDVYNPPSKHPLYVLFFRGCMSSPAISSYTYCRYIFGLRSPRRRIFSYTGYNRISIKDAQLKARSKYISETIITSFPRSMAYL